MKLLLVLLLAAAGSADLKRARDRFEFGAYADCAGAVRAFLSEHPDPPEAEAVEAYRMLGIAEYHLGDQDQARSAFVTLLSHDPDFALDPFLVPPRVVEFFDKVKRDHEPDLEPLRERRRQMKEQERLAEEAKRRLLSEEQARTGPPTKIIRVQDRLYMLNWVPFGAGQFQNGQTAKGVAIAAGEVALAALNLGALIFRNQLMEDRSRRCSPSQCANPPFTDADRSLLSKADVIKYSSAALFWALYSYGVLDAHLHYVPRVETEITPGGGPTGAKLSWAF
jgi:hypothetical protein